MKRVAFILISFLLAGAVALQFWQRREVGPGKGLHLATALPGELPGWSGKSLPLGATEAVSGAVEKTLRFDDVYFREFRSRIGVISLYAAYWGPGKMPTQLVASHTPDRCWAENGWTCDEVAHEVAPTSQSPMLLPGEWRVFSAPGGQKLNVLFWHRVGGELYDYGHRINRMPSVWRWWRDAARQALRSPPEQYFIRLTSDVPFERLRGDPGWEQMLAALRRIGLEPTGRRNAAP